MKNLKIICSLALVFFSVVSSRADTLYLFAGDRAPNAARANNIYRYAIEDAQPGVLAPAPTAGNEGPIWGSSVGKPYQGKIVADMVIAPNGDVYAVCGDTGSVVRYDGQTGADKGEIITGLHNPLAIAVGPDGNFYVTNDETIVRFKPDGTPLPGDGQIGNLFGFGGRLKAASGLVFGPDGNLYVASQATSQILRFDGQSGEFLGVFQAGDISVPSQIAFGPDGNLYVASTGGPGFNAESGFVAKIDGTTGKLISKFAPAAKGAFGFAFGANNDFYVTDYWVGKITRYDAKTGEALGVVVEGNAFGAFAYLALARQEKPTSRLQPVNVKFPTRAETPMKNKSILPGAQTIKGWKDALIPKGVAGPLLTLVSKKQSDYAIILPANSSTMDQKAAALLTLHLRQMTGAQLPIVVEGSGAKMGSKVISIGHTALLQKADPKTFALDLGDEGYAIAAQGNNLFLVGGKTRGAIYAVYSLLEEDLGCRWYGSDGVANIPQRDTLSFKPTLRHSVPVLELRDPLYVDAFNANWSLENKTNGPYAPVPAEWGGHMGNPPGYFVHTYNRMIPPDKYFKEHPEYFAEVGGKRQPSQLELTNPDVLRLVIEDVKKQLRENPDARIISVSPNDGRGYSESAESRAIDEAEATVPGSKTGTLLKFVNAVAEAIEPEFPNVKVSTLAYLDTFMPPKTIRPRKNVIIHLATDSHAWKYQFCFTTESRNFQTAMKAWDAIGADIYIWDYTTDYVHWMVPMPNMPVVTDNMKFYMQHGAKGIMLEGDSSSLGGDRAPMRVWVWAKQMWNPELDTRALMRDFVFGYYGDAAQPMWDYNMMLWQMWETAHAIPHKDDDSKPVPNPLLLNDSPCSAPPDWIMLSPEYLEKSTKLFAQAKALAKDPLTLLRVQVAELSLMYVKLGQGLGYVTEFGDYHAGSWAKTGDPAQKAEYEKLLNEFVANAKSGNVTHISAASLITDLIPKWQTILARKGADIPTQKLNVTWKFKTDAEKVGVAQNWFAPKTDDAAWADIATDKGRGWENQGFTDYTGVAWYRQNVAIPADFAQRKHLYLYFGSVDSESEIYINGEKAFDHTMAATGLTAGDIWQTPFAFDASKWLKRGQENTIAVRVTSAGGVRGILTPAFLFSSDDVLDAAKLKDIVMAAG